MRTTPMGSQMRVRSCTPTMAASGPRTDSPRATSRADRGRPRGGRANSHAGGGVEVGAKAQTTADVQEPRRAELLERLYESDEGIGS